MIESEISLTSRQTVLFRRGQYTISPSNDPNSKEGEGLLKPILNLNSMPHKVYHGKTGVVYNVTKSAVGVIIYKKVKHRYIEKRVNLRVEHVSLSRSREEFVRRVKTNAELKKKSKTEGTHVHLKRQPLMPREARTISMKENVPETVVPIAYETTI
jgi:large subunit ribosomal protein L21e